MSDWARTTLDQIAGVREERVLPRQGDQAPYVGLEHIQSGRARLLAVGRAGETISQKTVFHAGDVLFGKLRPALRKVVRPEFDGVCSTDILAIYPKSADDGAFLEQLLGSDAFMKHAAQSAAGTKMPRTSWADLRRYAFSCPPPARRRQIGCVLGAVDEASDKTLAVVEATRHFQAVLVDALLTEGLPERHREWRRVPGVGMIPACWDVPTLGDVADIQTGRAVKRGAVGPGTIEVPYLSVANVKDGYVDLGLVKTMHLPSREVPRFALRCGDVLFTEGGDPDKLGRGCVWQAEIDPCLHQNHIFAVRPHPELRSGFLALYAASSAGKAYFLSCAKQTTNLASINSTQLKQLPVPLPSIAEQECILDVVNSIPGADEHLRELIALKRGVARLLLSGGVPVLSGVDSATRAARRT